VNVNGAVVALETKLGIGASAASGASDGDALTKQADGSTAWEAVPSGVSWSGSTANGLATYGSGSSVVSESTATYDGTTLTLTQSGGGLKMDGLASADANTLDDYEEGTWTCSLVPATGSIALTAGWATGSYVKVGQLVTVMGQFNAGTVSTPSGTLSLQGLPFTVLSMAAHAEESVAPFLIVSPASDLQSMVMIANTGAATAQIYGTWCDAGGSTNSPASLIDDGSGSFGVCFSYPAA